MKEDASSASTASVFRLTGNIKAYDVPWNVHYGVNVEGTVLTQMTKFKKPRISEGGTYNLSNKIVVH